MFTAENMSIFQIWRTKRIIIGYKNPFRVKADRILTVDYENLFRINSDTQLKAKFGGHPVANFWGDMFDEYPGLSKRTIRVL